jgi:alkanesulfonate monooxygenase SsuD/methylene tetrahydromethanopterin reductase-like flavin-dependent oxidoreductase (luciferase family)
LQVTAPTAMPDPGARGSVPDMRLGFASVLDPMAALTVAANATSRVTLGTSVLNLPWYPPTMLARTLTTVDVS